jgi:hypothetical protein
LLEKGCGVNNKIIGSILGAFFFGLNLQSNPMGAFVVLAFMVASGFWLDSWGKQRG